MQFLAGKNEINRFLNNPFPFRLQPLFFFSKMANSFPERF